MVTVSGNTTQDLVAVPGSDVTGTVSSSNGTVESGDVFFFATCQDYENGKDLLNDYINDGVYTVTVPAGSYRVLIDPDDEYGALESWHSAKPTCDQATVVTVAGDTTVNLVAMAEGASPSPTPSVSPSTPGPTPTQSTPPPPGNQSVKKPPAKLTKGKSAALAKTSEQGNRVTWKSTTKKLCKVKLSKVKGLKKGKCVLKATVPATSTFLAYSQKFTIRVK